MTQFPEFTIQEFARSVDEFRARKVELVFVTGNVILAYAQAFCQDLLTHISVRSHGPQAE